MATVSFEERVLSQVIDQYLVSRRNREWPFSMACAVKAIKAVSHNSKLSDEDLGGLIARAAIAKRYNIAFDLSVAVP